MLSAGVCRTGLFPLSEIKPYLPAIADVYFLSKKEYLSIQQDSENKTILIIIIIIIIIIKLYYYYLLHMM